MFLALDTFESVQKLFVETKKALGEILSAFEFLDRRSLETVKACMHWSFVDKAIRYSPLKVFQTHCQIRNRFMCLLRHPDPTASTTKR